MIVGLLPRVGRKTEETPVVATTGTPQETPTESRFDRETEREPETRTAETVEHPVGKSLDELLLAHRGTSGHVALLRALVELLARQPAQLVVVAVVVLLGDPARGVEALAQRGHEVGHR